MRNSCDSSIVHGEGFNNSFVITKRFSDRSNFPLTYHKNWDKDFLFEKQRKKEKKKQRL